MHVDWTRAKDWGDVSLSDDHLHLVRAAKAGDKEAFTHLVRLYKNFLFRTAFAIVRDHGEAEDVVQESFVKAFLSLLTLKDERAFPSWITTITSRIALDTVRRRRTNVDAFGVPIPNPELVPAHPSTPDLRLDISEAMSRLSPEHRAVVILREVQGFDYKEIADFLEVPIGTVRSRLHIARMQLRNLLHTNGERG